VFGEKLLSSTRIEGSISDERGAPYRECRMELLAGERGRVLESRTISSQFAVTFVVNAHQPSVPLRISCKESDETFEASTSAPHLLSDLLPIDPPPLDLGNVRLRRRAG
jgi:hypothetical protein